VTGKGFVVIGALNPADRTWTSAHLISDYLRRYTGMGQCENSHYF